jgi:hypothetical protein
MDDMAAAVADITRSSEETGKIIKTIDEIASDQPPGPERRVEAARAGEAGAGSPSWPTRCGISPAGLRGGKEHHDLSRTRQGSTQGNS